MKNIFLTTALGALFGAVISVSVPCCGSKGKFIRKSNRFFKKSKRIKSQIIKKVSALMYKLA